MRVADELPGRLTVVCCMYLLRRDISNPCQFLSSIRRKREIHGRGKQWGSVLASFMAIYHYNRTRVNILRYPGKRYILIHSKTMTSHLHNSVPLRVSPFSKGKKKNSTWPPDSQIVDEFASVNLYRLELLTIFQQSGKRISDNLFAHSAGHFVVVQVLACRESSEEPCSTWLS